MVLKVDYYALLSGAVESLDRDAYAARGAIYDREHKALLKRLISSDSPCSDANIAREEQAFRDAIRRIEFPHEGVQLARTPRREPAERKWRDSGWEKTSPPRREFPREPPNFPERMPSREVKRRGEAADEEAGEEPHSRQIEPPPGKQRAEPDRNGRERSRSIVRRIAGHALIVAILLGAGTLGYALVVGAVDLSWPTIWPGQDAPSPRAVLYEAGQSGRTGTPVAGKATWRTRTEPTGSAGKPDLVVTLDVEIPERQIALTMSLSRVVDAGAGMSHLFELRFARPEDLPFGGISKISNIAVKGAETESGDALVGTSIMIAPGQFLFGLLGVEDIVRENVRRLRQPWLDIAIVFANGPAQTLTIEKGAAGERAFNEAFAKWAQ